MRLPHSLKVLAFSFLELASTQVFAQSKREKLASSSMVRDKETGRTAAWNLSGGVILGAPTGLVLKNEFAADQAVDFGLSYSFNDMFEFYGDWHYRFPNVLRNAGGFASEIEAYAGLGAAILIASSGGGNPVRREDRNASFGIMLRIPLGLQYKLPGKPLAFFVELVPGIGIVPGTFAYFGGGLGARYYF